jgi:site-specific DNA recombinase
MNNGSSLLTMLLGDKGQGIQAIPRKVKALGWARVSTDMQEARNLSIPEQLKQIREYAEKHEIDIVQEYSETASAYQSKSKRLEFAKMLQHAQDSDDISAILIHDFSRFSRDSTKAKALARELRDQGIKIISLNDPDFDTDTVAGVYMEAITFAKNEAYSKEVAFHTRKGCKANVNTRDEQTGWCYKNGGIPLWGYKTVRLERGQERKGVPIIKAIWELDDAIVADRPVHEWAKHFLVELAMTGASLAEIRDFLNRHGVPPRHNEFWSLSSIKSLLTVPALLKYAGYEVWNVRRKNGTFKPPGEWVIVEKAHPAIITPDEAKVIAEKRQSQSREKRFDKGFGISRKSDYVLSGGLFVCDRCGSNMIGFRRDKEHIYYTCGSLQYRKGAGCGSGVYVPQREIEDEVIDGLSQLMRRFTVLDSFTVKVNRELQRIWKQQTGISGDSRKELKSIESKIKNIYKAIEDGLPFDPETRKHLDVLIHRKAGLEKLAQMSKNPPKIDSEIVKNYRNKLEKELKSSNNADRKKILRECVEKIKLVPENLEIEITYKLPKPVVDVDLAGDGLEPSTFGL